MTGNEVKEIREKLGMDRDQFAVFLCLSGYQSMMNIETGFRQPNRFTAKILKYLNSIPKAKALKMIEEINANDSH